MLETIIIIMFFLRTANYLSPYFVAVTFDVHNLNIRTVIIFVTVDLQ
jgi:hypothetical protein